MPVKQELSSVEDEVSPRIDRLFLKFAAFYGYVWRNLYKNSEFLQFSKLEWQKALLEFDDSTLEAALVLCSKTKELPPTLSQFIDICKAVRASHIVVESRPKPFVRNMEVAEFYLKQMKTMLA